MLFWSVTISFLENEIDKGVVFLGGQDDQREAAKREADGGFGNRHALRPIPRLFPGPNDERGHGDREQVIRLVKNSAEQGGAGLRGPESEHAGEVGERVREIDRAEEYPAKQY